MRRRTFTLTTLLSVLYPLAARATNADMDPNGIMAPAPESMDWLDSVFRAFLALLGV